MSSKISCEFNALKQHIMYSVHVWYSTSKSGSSESMDEAARPPLDEPGAPGLGKAAMELGKLERTVDLQRCVRWSWRERERVAYRAQRGALPSADGRETV